MTAVAEGNGARPYAFLAVVVAAALAAGASALAYTAGHVGPGEAGGEDPAPSSALVEGGCTACHASEGGKSLAPSLDGVYSRAGRRVGSDDYAGSAPDAEGYLLESILDHCADPLPGWDCSDAPQFGNWIDLDEAYRLVDAMTRSR